ncbi:MAG: hypothetical protein KKA90_00905 [Nanoarchaeota archaeon]|nr:hypothetical protein [Nanoarchaeota archaeon]
MDRREREILYPLIGLLVLLGAFSVGIELGFEGKNAVAGMFAADQGIEDRQVFSQGNLPSTTSGDPVPGGSAGCTGGSCGEPVYGCYKSCSGSTCTDECIPLPALPTGTYEPCFGPGDISCAC